MRKHEEQLALMIALEQHEETIRYGRVMYETTENPEKLLTILSYLEGLQEVKGNIEARLESLSNN